MKSLIMFLFSLENLKGNIGIGLKIKSAEYFYFHPREPYSFVSEVKWKEKVISKKNSHVSIATLQIWRCENSSWTFPAIWNCKPEFEINNSNCCCSHFFLYSSEVWMCFPPRPSNSVRLKMIHVCRNINRKHARRIWVRSSNLVTNITLHYL